MKNIIIKIPDNCELIKEDNTTFKIIIAKKYFTKELNRINKLIP